MKAFVALLIYILLPAIAAAESEVYFGKFFDARYPVAPNSRRQAAYVAGITVTTPVADLPVELRANVETLMDDYNGDGSFRPGGVKYDIAGRWQVTEHGWLDVSRMCDHTIDSWGNIEEYWLVKMGYRW